MDFLRLLTYLIKFFSYGELFIIYCVIQSYIIYKTSLSFYYGFMYGFFNSILIELVQK